MTTRNELFEYPQIAKRWREDYRRHLNGGDNNYLVTEFAEELDNWMMPSLRRAHFIGLITNAEFVEIGADIWEEWTLFSLEVKRRLINCAFVGYV